MKALGIAAVFALLTLVIPAKAEQWDLPTYVPEKSFHVTNLKQFAADVRKSTDGRIDIRVHPAGALIKEEEVKPSVRSGIVPIGAILMSSLGNEDPLFELDSIPFLATSYKDAMRLWDASRDEVDSVLAKQGLVAIFTVPWNPQGLFSTNPLETVDDLQGRKFRTYNKITARLAELAGAIPTQVAIGDVATAFSTGRIDVMVTSPVTGANRSAWDYTSHFYHTQGWLPKEIVLMNKRALESISEADRRALLDAAVEAEKRGWNLSEKDTLENGVDVLKANGMLGIEPPEALIVGLREIGETIAREWVTNVGEGGEAILKNYKGE